MTEAQLAAMPYANSPFSQGILVDDYNKEFAQHGELIRHDRCFRKAPEEMAGPNGETVERDGNLYIENEDARDARVLIGSTERDIMDAEFGLISQGQTSISCDPAIIELARYDRVILISRRVLSRQAFAPSGEARDELDFYRAAEIVSLSAGEATLEVEDDGRSFLRWIGAPPPLCRVEFRYLPQYVYLDVSDRNPPRGADGKRLLQRGVLTLENRKS